MSGHDLYLVLRERVETVAKGFSIGKDVLDAAQQLRGYSHETMGRKLGISEKTWRRWKDEGVVPYDHLDDVVKVLRLEVERPTQRIILGEEGQEPREPREILEQVIGQLERLLAQLPPREPVEAPSEQRG